MPLSGKQRRQLRSLGHHLQVIVQVGADGVTDGVISAVAQALKDHELIKVKIAGEDREGRDEAAEKLAGQTGSEIAQQLGRTVLLWKKRDKKSKIQLVAG
ncbi:MAG: ribosome assembly RNA-binding protein YhbY [Myxococcaceae bacterium]